MKIGGLQKLSLIDYPGKTAATVFLVGCNFKCGFCHNPELVKGNIPEISEKEFFSFLDERKDFLDGVCITGGEPTIHKDLISFVKKIKKKGFLVKLDTNGSNPEMLKKLLGLIDFVAMDIKTSKKGYDKAVGKKVDFKKIEKSVELIKNSKVDYEFRTTVVPGIVGDFEEIGKWLKGVKKYVLQQFQNKKVLDKSFKKIEPYSNFKDFEKILKKYIKNIEIR